MSLFKNKTLLITGGTGSFGNAILNDTVPPVTADDAIFVQRLIESAYKSNDKKKFIKL